MTTVQHPAERSETQTPRVKKSAGVGKKTPRVSTERGLSLPPGGDEGVDGDEARPLAASGVEHEGLPVERAAARLRGRGGHEAAVS